MPEGEDEAAMRMHEEMVNEQMLDDWVKAKRMKNYSDADRIRDELRAKGIEPEKKRPGFDARAAPPKPPPPPEIDIEEQLDLWVKAKRAKDFATADRIRGDLRIRGVEPEAARPNWLSGEGGAAAASSSAVPLPPPPPLPSRSIQLGRAASGSTPRMRRSERMRSAVL